MVPMRRLMAAVALAALLAVTCGADTLICDTICLAGTPAPQHVSSRQNADVAAPAAGKSGHPSRHHHHTGRWSANQNTPAAALDHQAGLHHVIATPNCVAYDQVLSLRASSNERLIKGPVAVPVDSNPAIIESNSSSPDRTTSLRLELGSPPRVTQLRI